MNYENMSDEQLNVKLKNAIFGDKWVTESALRKWDFNNPADAWPIIAANKINIDFQYGSARTRCQVIPCKNSMHANSTAQDYDSVDQNMSENEIRLDELSIIKNALILFSEENNITNESIQAFIKSLHDRKNDLKDKIMKDTKYA